MKIYILYNYENKSCESYSEIIGAYATRELAEKEMMAEIHNHLANYNNKQYYFDEYESGCIITKDLPDFDFAVMSKGDSAFYNAFRITEYEVEDSAKVAFIVYQEINLPNPKKCFKGDVYVSGDLEKAQAFIASDSKDYNIAIDEGQFGNVFNDVLVPDDLDDYVYTFDEIILSKDYYYIGWSINEMDIKTK